MFNPETKDQEKGNVRNGNTWEHGNESSITSKLWVNCELCVEFLLSSQSILAASFICLNLACFYNNLLKQLLIAFDQQ